jgi:3-hydroxyacyl-CoA dehydrogenase
MFCKPSTKQSNKEYGLYWTKQQISLWVLIGMIFMMAVEQEYDKHGNQNISGYSACAFINSCSCSWNDFWWLQMSLHADKVAAAAETYMGLMGVGVGVTRWWWL